MFVQEVDLVLCDKQAEVMHKAAAAGRKKFIEEILVRGDTELLLQAKREGDGALPFQTALKKKEYATAIVLLKDKRYGKRVSMPAIPRTSTYISYLEMAIVVSVCVDFYCL